MNIQACFQRIEPEERRVDPLLAFVECADARALLWSIGEYSIDQAVDTLQADAGCHGIVKRIGQDAVNAILNDAFGRYAEASS